jgi:hypothetical protein
MVKIGESYILKDNLRIGGKLYLAGLIFCLTSTLDDVFVLTFLADKEVLIKITGNTFETFFKRF